MEEVSCKLVQVPESETNLQDGISVKTWDTKRSAELFASLLSIFIYLF